jgi:insertion element IS1 protein InsB
LLAIWVFTIGLSPLGQAKLPNARSTGACPGQRSGDGRVVQLYWREKNQIYVITIVDRLTRCYLGFQVVWQRTQEAIQELVDEAPKAKHYHSDAFEAYDHLWYHWGVYEVSQGKADTYSVEADNAELRHYLARLARRSRCFSRCPEALSAALKLFWLFYRRQFQTTLSALP